MIPLPRLPLWIVLLLGALVLATSAWDQNARGTAAGLIALLFGAVGLDLRARPVVDPHPWEEDPDAP